MLNIKPKYVVNEKGRKTATVLSMEDYRSLMQLSLGDFSRRSKLPLIPSTPEQKCRVSRARIRRSGC